MATLGSILMVTVALVILAGFFVSRSDEKRLREHHRRTGAGDKTGIV